MSTLQTGPSALFSALAVFFSGLSPLLDFFRRLPGVVFDLRAFLERSPAFIPGLLVFPLGVALGWVASAPPVGRPKLPDDLTQLDRALAEAHENCVMATLTDQDLGPSRRPLFPTRELQRALETPLLIDASYGELPALRREARWLATLTPQSDLGARSWEDTRLLLGAVHWYLDKARVAAAPSSPSRDPHPLRAEDYDVEAMHVYRGLDYTDLLGLWD